MKNPLLFFAVIMLLLISNSFSQATFSTGAMDVYVGAYGKVRLLTPDTKRHLQRASILVGTSSTTVYDHELDAEVVEETALVTSPTMSDFETYGAYDNSYSSGPPAVLLKVNAYGWTDKMYTIVKFNVKNNEATEVNASIGLEILPELHQTYGLDTVTYNSNEGVIRFHRGTGINMGMKLLSASLSSLYSFEWYEDYQVDTDFWTWMNKGTLQAEYISTTVEGPVAITSQAPVALAPGESVDVYYALALGADEQAMLDNIAAANLKYSALFSAVSDRQASGNGLRNYPNPVKSSTKITYQLPKEGFVSLKIYDALGNEAATLVNSKQSAGLQTIDFNAKNLSRGVYSYRLLYNNKVTTSKMIIVK